MQRSDLRAAFMWRNALSVPLTPKTADGLATLASRMNVSRDDLIERALSEWLETRLMDSVPGDDLIPSTGSDQRSSKLKSVGLE